MITSMILIAILWAGSALALDVDEALRLVRRSSELAPDTEYYREQILRFEAARRSP